MFGLFTKRTTTPTFSVEETPSGRFAIIHSTDGVVSTYARKRDAVRGADRKGITLVNA